VLFVGKLIAEGWNQSIQSHDLLGMPMMALKVQVKPSKIISYGLYLMSLGPLPLQWCMSGRTIFTRHPIKTSAAGSVLQSCRK